MLNALEYLPVVEGEEPGLWEYTGMINKTSVGLCGPMLIMYHEMSPMISQPSAPESF